MYFSVSPHISGKSVMHEQSLKQLIIENNSAWRLYDFFLHFIPEFRGKMYLLSIRYILSTQAPHFDTCDKTWRHSEQTSLHLSLTGVTNS